MIGSGAEVNGPTTGTSRSDAAYSLYSTTHYLFDALGRLVKIVDPKNNETSIIYDSLSRRRQMDHVDTASAWVFSYDKNGNLKSQTDSKGHTVTFSYDPLNRITEKLYPGGGKVLYDYDDDAVANSDGKLTRARVVDSAGVDQSRVEFAYDKIGRATTTKYMVRDSSAEVSRSFVNTYDSMSRIKSIKYPDNETVNYFYDTGGNISQISGYATFPSYTALGQAKTIAYANGVATDLTYWNTHQRLETLQTTGPGGALQGLYYDIYDKAGNIRSIQDNLATARAQTFTYKPIPSNPLATARSTAYGNLGLTYDVSDNITNYTPVGVYTPKTGYSGLIAEAGPYVFSHDSNGNTRVIVENDAQGVEVGRRTITYDYDHRVISVNVSGTATRCAYDFSGMRVKKQTGASSTLYFGELYESTDGSNLKHIFAGSRRIASKKSANEIYYYHTDHLGSTRVLTDKNGNEVQTFFYEPFGNTKAVTGSSPINYKYTGQEEDTETGLYYYKARYYDPVIGRFISHDPIFQAAFDPPTFPRLINFNHLPKEPPVYAQATGDTSASIRRTGLNPLAYVRNNPISLIDPLGLVDLAIGPRDTEDDIKQAYWAEYIPSRPGTFSVAVHKNLITGNLVGNDGNRLYMFQLANMIAGHDNYVPGMEIDFFVCYGAMGGEDSLGQHLAEEMKFETGYYTKVNAPDKLMWIGSEEHLGQYFIAGEDAKGKYNPGDPGNWVQFPIQPQSVQTENFSAEFSFGGSMGGSSFSYSYGFSFGF